MKTKIVINLNNLINNFNFVKDYIKNKTEYTINNIEPELIPVVKNNAYGIGQNEVVDILLKNNQKMFFVFCLDEALELRQVFKNKIEKLFVLIGNLKNEQEIFYKNNLIPVINNFEQFNDWLELAKKYNVKLTLVLQFNTGMNRNGFNISDIKTIKSIIQNNYNYLNVEFIMSHFGAPEDKSNQQTIQQLKNLKIINENFPNFKKSFAASFGIFNIIESIKDYSRPGIILYGWLGKLFKDNLKPVLNLISYIKFDSKGFYIPLGLENNFTKKYCKNGFVYINNEKIKLKSITKNKIYLYNNKNIKENDEVLICGKHDNNQLNLDDFGNFFDNNIYEIQKLITDNLLLYPNDFKKIIIGSKIYYTKYQPKYYLANKNINFYKTKIFEIINIFEDGFLGYDATYKVKIGECYALIFNGYADTFSRTLYNKGYKLLVKIENNYVECEICGKISMDQVIVKIPDNYKNKVKLYDNVSLFKKNFSFLKTQNSLNIEEKNLIKNKILINKRCLNFN